MPGLSSTQEAYILAGVLNTFGNPFGTTQTLTIALFTNVTNVDTVSGTEVSGGGYVRQSIVFGAPQSGVCANTAAVTFPAATVDWGTVTHFAIRSSDQIWVTAATPLTVGGFASSQTVNAGDVLTFPAGSITVGFSS
jgi:hypothetical protein